ncbi:MAG: hypothetical protein QXT86_09975 [Archaeoglobaceae archaeon]
MEGKLYFNMVANVGTDEVTLIPYPNGLAKVPDDRYRYVYTIVVSNTSTDLQTITLRIYRDGSLENEVPIVVQPQSTIQIGGRTIPILMVPPGRILKAVATGSVVLVALVADE